MAIGLFRLAICVVSAVAMLAPGMVEARSRAAPAQYGNGYSDQYVREPEWRERRAPYSHGHDRPGRGYRCDRGSGGTIIGAIAGGLLGNSVAGRGDRTVGTVVGAGAGALAGRAIDRDC